MSRILDGLIPDSDFEELFKTEKERKQKELAEQMERFCKKKLPDRESRRALHDAHLQLQEVMNELTTKVIDALFKDVQEAMAELQREVQPEQFDKVKKVAKFAFLSGQYIGGLCSLTSYQEVLDSQKGRRIGAAKSLKTRQAKSERIKEAITEIQKESKRKLTGGEIRRKLQTKKYNITLSSSQLYEIMKKLP
jgi:hypothetical protein